MENETQKKDEAGNLHKPPVGSSACPVCNGDGWYADHASSDLHDEDGQCCGYCPIQVQCETCEATGIVTNEELIIINKNMERIKLSKTQNDEMPF